MEITSYQLSMNLEFQRSQDWGYIFGNLHLKYVKMFPIFKFLWITQSQPKGLSRNYQKLLFELNLRELPTHQVMLLRFSTD